MGVPRGVVMQPGAGALSQLRHHVMINGAIKLDAVNMPAVVGMLNKSFQGNMFELIGGDDVKHNRDARAVFFWHLNAGATGADVQYGALMIAGVKIFNLYMGHEGYGISLGVALIEQKLLCYMISYAHGLVFWFCAPVVF